mmetsp:Transcript_32179/g.54041  ORF Transcript_32179/g.54041 Transcript_32179/m.54041 type:complete len:333 (-) Transcript_32179:84-1082(-)|eukprot:CAMPEP_0198208288 /NCGR_PEP_ID=MMETSP1445-20131203/11672_1 /TAXON_ID=36898 /ORGANISM="Pyramimonas sp., Strain CCMP2087" /LENGTH=332 /DNA_ID=CAMNT_0043881631 /DNA_START=95 /DNA_END=1093 /DNA_ORIENTATION=-
MTILTLAALDVGSGSTKLDVAKVDTRSIPWRIVGELLYSENVELLLAADYKSNPDGKLSTSIMDSTMEVISRLQAIAHKHDAKMRGVATAVFRLATNANELLDRLNNELGIALEVVSQEEEGKIGFLTAASGLPEPEEARKKGLPPLTPVDVVAWDSGGASFQLTISATCGFDVYQGPLGASLVTAMLLEKVQKRSFASQPSPNPVSLLQIQELCVLVAAEFPDAPVWLREKLANQAHTQVIGIGGETCIFSLASQILEKTEYTTEEVWSGIEKLAGSTDAELSKYSQAHMVIPKLVLMHTVMNTIGIRQVRYLPSNGGCRGVLISPKYWAD